MKKTTFTTLAAPMAFCALMAVPMLAQTTGTSNPPEAMIEDKPAPAIVIPPPPAAEPSMKPSPMVAAESSDSLTPTLKQRPAFDSARPLNADDDIVSELSAGPNELPQGTVIHVRLSQDIATDQTSEGTMLMCELAQDVVRNGRIMLPAGTPFLAQVTDVRGGKRIHGAAKVHIQPRNLVLKDGTRLPLHAVLIDTDKFDDTKVDAEGNLVRKDHVGGTIAAMSLATGGAAAAGGVIAGPAGALVGAAVGAGASTVWWLKQDRQMHVSSGATMIFQLTSPLSLDHENTSSGQ